MLKIFKVATVPFNEPMTEQEQKTIQRFNESPDVLYLVTVPLNADKSTEEILEKFLYFVECLDPDLIELLAELEVERPLKFSVSDISTSIIID